MKKEIQNAGIFLALNAAFIVVLVLFAMNRDLADEMMSVSGPLLLITSGALIYTVYFEGDMMTAMAASLLLEIGQMTQVLILGEGGISTKSKILLMVTPLIGAVGVWLVTLLETKDFHDAVCGKKYLLISGGLLLLVLLVLLVFGKEKNGTKAWIGMGSVSIQPTEFLKPLYVFFHAVLWSSSIERRKGFLLSLGLTAVVGIMLLAINELGTLLVILMLWILLTFIFSEKLIHSTIALGLTATGILSGYGMLSLVHSKVEKLNQMGEEAGGILLKLNLIYKKLHDRMMIVFDEDSLFANAAYRTGDGYQFYKAREMILKGGLLGTTSSTHVPVEDSDYAFVGLILRCGIVFAIVALILFFLIFFRTMLKSVNIGNRFESIVLSGTSLSLILPTFINVMGTTNFGFMTGICIPFISSGGSSMLLTTFNIMLLLWGMCERRPNLNGRFFKKNVIVKEVPFTR